MKQKLRHHFPKELKTYTYYPSLPRLITYVVGTFSFNPADGILRISIVQISEY
jgi:hypothetical protein